MSDTYEVAMRRFQEHIIRNEDGTFRLEAADGTCIGINDPSVFADLKRSMEHTNTLIRRGELDPKQVEMLIP